MAPPSKSPESNAPNQPTPAADQQNTLQVEVTPEKTSTTYANFCRVAGAPEELFIDFGINPQPMTEGTGIIDVMQRVTMNYYTAKRFAQVLMMSIQQHEQAFGVIEVDVRKRVVDSGTQQ